MVLNLGYIEGTLENNDVVVRIYYDTAWLTDAPTRDPVDAPLVNGPRGWCLDITNISGRHATFSVSGVSNTPLSMTVAQGDPVTTGPTSGRSRTAAQMTALGFTTRGSVGNFQLGE